MAAATGDGRIFLCVATQKGLAVLEALVRAGAGPDLVVCTLRERDVEVSYHEAIERRAAEAGARVVPWSAFSVDPPTFLADHGIGRILCIGWRYVVPEAVLAALPERVIVAHDSLLPKLRGFSPLITALLIGAEETGVTFFRAGRSVDDGDVLWQGAVKIAPDETHASLIDKVTPLYEEGAVAFYRGELREAWPQDEAAATYSIWRDLEDHRLDWGAAAEEIERAVRAMGAPYLGARTTLAGETVVLRAAEVVPDLTFAIRQPGKIWSLDAGRPTVVCGRGMLRITALEAADGRDLLPLRRLKARFQ